MIISDKSLISVIVPTKNSSKFLDQCLSSIINQTYKHIELIVVDNYSTDKTILIAKKYTHKIFLKGPERSAQVNYGVFKSKGKYIYKVDSDFVLDSRVVKQCLEKVHSGYDAVVVHNSPDTNVSWIAKIRKFETDMYKYDLTYSSARFLKKSVFLDIGGFNEKITAGEDYDFQNRLNAKGFKTGFISAEAIHLGEPTNILNHLTKYYFYGKDFINYSAFNDKYMSKQLGFFRTVYLRNWIKFFKYPLFGLVFIVYHSLKYIFSGFGYIIGYTESLINKNEN